MTMLSRFRRPKLRQYLDDAAAAGVEVAATNPNPDAAVKAARMMLQLAGPAVADEARITVRRPSPLGQMAVVSVTHSGWTVTRMKEVTK